MPLDTLKRLKPTLIITTSSEEWVEKNLRFAQSVISVSG